MRKIFILIFVIALPVFAYFFYLENEKYFHEKFPILNTSKLPSQEINPENSKTEAEIQKEIDAFNAEIESSNLEVSESDIAEKISKLRTRYSLESIISDGDKFFDDGMYILALKNYNDALFQNPNDDLIIEKIGDVYVEMKNFDKAFETFSKISNYSENASEKLFLSKLYSSDLKKVPEIVEIKAIISQMPWTGEDKYIYSEVMNCPKDFHICKKNLETYFSNNKNMNSKLGIEINDAIQRFWRLTNPDELYYKDSLISGVFLKFGLYNVASETSQKVLEDYPDYLTALQIAAQSEFNLGNYEKAKEFLMAYNRIDYEDASVNYMLGIISIRLSDYVFASVTLNRAKELGYEPKIDIDEKLIYIYDVTKNKIRLKNALEEILNNPESTKSHYSLAIYYNIVNGYEKEAEIIAGNAIRQFPEDGDFYAYLSWINRERGIYEVAKNQIEKGISLSPDNSFLLLNAGQLYFELEDFETAKIYLQKLSKNDSNSEFGVEAKNLLLEIERKEKNKKNIFGF